MGNVIIVFFFNSLHAWKLLMLLLSSADFLKLTFPRNSLRTTIRVSNHLGPNCLRRLSADYKAVTSKEGVYILVNWLWLLSDDPLCDSKYKSMRKSAMLKGTTQCLW